MRFNICKIEPLNYLHSNSFNDLSKLLCFGIIDSGYKCTLSSNKLANNCVYTDFTETVCVNTNEKIDSKITNYLNKKLFFEKIIIYKIIQDKINFINNNISTNKNIILY